MSTAPARSASSAARSTTRCWRASARMALARRAHRRARVAARSVRVARHRLSGAGGRACARWRSSLTMARFAGMVLAFQFGYGLERFGAKLYIGQTTVTALLRELGPILTALVVGGRIGAGIAAELGGMAVTEQIDAVRALGADPVQRLVAPRILAVHASRCRCSRVVADVVGAVGRHGRRAGCSTASPPRLFVTASTNSSRMGDFASGLFKTVRLRRHHRRDRLLRGRARRAAAPKASAAPPPAPSWPRRCRVLGADFLLTKLLLSAVMRATRRACAASKKALRRQAHLRRARSRGASAARR